MTEQSTSYKVDRPTLPREQVLHSAYFQAVASTADSMIMANALGMTYPMKAKELFREEIDETIELAIAFTDKLITAAFLYEASYKKRALKKSESDRDLKQVEL